jgi:arylmalonate decarboxylase
MNTANTRRAFLKAAGAATAGIGATVWGAASEPVLGMIFPPLNRPVPEEGLIMYPTGVTFLVEGLGLESLTPEGYDKVIDRIKPAAEKLASRGAKAIALMGTSLSFYKGAAFNQQLTDTIKRATGLPATTMSAAVVEGLRTVGGRRLAVATAYNDEVNARLNAFLKESGFEVVKLKGLGITDMDSPAKVTEPELLKFSAGVYASAREANAMLVSCGGLRTLEILAPLEQQTHVPAVSSTPHALRAGVRLLGLSGKVNGFGTLLAKG